MSTLRSFCHIRVNTTEDDKEQDGRTLHEKGYAWELMRDRGTGQYFYMVYAIANIDASTVEPQ